MTIGPFLTSSEVARIFRVNQRTIGAWVRNKRLSALSTGGVLRFAPEDVEAFIAASTKEAAA